MKHSGKSTVGAAGLAALMLLPAPGFALSGHDGAREAATMDSGPEGIRLAHMGGSTAGMMAPAQGYAAGQCPHAMMAGMMGGMMAPGPMGPAMGQGYGQGPMSPGMMAPGIMGPGMMNPGMMGPGQGYGMMPGAGAGADLSVDDVRVRLQRSLDWHGNPRLRIGDVMETDEGKITAEIVTQDGSLVQRFLVDRQTGAMRPGQ